MSLNRYFRLAKQVALKGDSKDARRHYRLGAVGVRSDGAIVTSSNIPNRTPEPQAHAEARLARKLDWESIVYVARVHSDGSLALARPCQHCQAAMRLRGVKTCHYSIADDEFGVMNFT